MTDEPRPLSDDLSPRTAQAALELARSLAAFPDAREVMVDELRRRGYRVTPPADDLQPDLQPGRLVERAEFVDP